MTDNPAVSLDVAGLTEAVTAGVLRALAAHQSATDQSVDIGALIKSGGLFGSVVIIGGAWPSGDGKGVIGLPGVAGGLIGGGAPPTAGG